MRWSSRAAAFVGLGLTIAGGCPPSLSAQEAFPLPEIGLHHHPVATTSAEAQRFFDYGMTLIYAFNHDAAVRAFQRAAELDPKAAMPQWGIALALGPNINLDVDPERERAASAAVERAKALARRAPQPERDYVEALSRRYSPHPDADLKALAVEYSVAMGELSKRYPDDLDAATLYAESLMDLRPWRLWSPDGTPAEGTPVIVALLESVLRRDPEHIGANHYYIHAIEASGHPERALASAKRLETRVPWAGHLVHMPAHVYMQLGDYGSAARSNEAGAAADRAYIERTGAQGVYPIMYYSHNLHFLSDAYGMEGRFTDSRRAAEQLVANVQPAVRDMPMGEFLMGQPMLVDLRFARWNDVLAAPEPAPDLPITRAFWRFARGVAQAATGKTRGAEAERAAFASTRQQVPPDAVYGDTGLNSAHAVLDLASHILDARIARSRGDLASAVTHLRKAVAAQDGLAYDEPPTWFYPVRESLGATLLLGKRYGEAEEVFRADLQRNPRNGRSLFGLLESLTRQGRGADASWVRMQFEVAWRNAESTLHIEDL